MFYHGLVARMKRKGKMARLRKAVRPKVRKYIGKGITIKTQITRKVVGSEKFKIFKEVYDTYRAVLLEAKSQV